MVKRAVKYVSKIAEKIRTNPAYAESFIRSAVLNHGDSIESAIAAAIDQYGHAEFACKSEMTPGNVTRLVKRLKQGEDVKVRTLRLAFEILGIPENRHDELILEGSTNQKSTPLAKIWKIYEQDKKYGT